MTVTPGAPGRAGAGTPTAPGAPAPSGGGSGGGTTGGSAAPPMDDNEAAVERTRAVTGLVAVVLGDVAIAIAAILGVYAVRNSTGGSASVVAVVSSAFTAVATLTTAYFGIKATANTAKNTIAHSAVGGTPQQPG